MLWLRLSSLIFQVSVAVLLGTTNGVLMDGGIAAAHQTCHSTMLGAAKALSSVFYWNCSR